jgi:hypothetical protein
MKRLALICAVLFTACAVDTSDTSDELLDEHGGPPDARVHYARDAQPGGGGAGSSPQLIYHGGPVMTSGAAVQPIFWGTSWASSSFVGDKITGIQSFYGGMGGTTYDGTNGEYTDGSGHVGSGVTLGSTHVDTSASARSGSRTGPILAEVCAQITNPVPNGYYPVYDDHPRGHAGYCAWHSTGTCNGVQVQFAFFFNLDGDPGCDPGGALGGHSQGTTALANVSGHELSEALTDPHLDAWYDSSGAENADKCAWKFGTNLLRFSNNTTWRIQGNWSNNAFTANQGYGGNIGCIDGTN